jgi:predicted SprT family Zn-dependent metalloprotease
MIKPTNEEIIKLSFIILISINNVFTMENIWQLQDQRSLKEVENFAKGLLLHFGLVDWHFKFDNSKSRAGCCHGKDKHISVSRYYATKAHYKDLVNTLLHEIAHALVGTHHKHDDVWRQKARLIGCTGDRCHSIRFATPKWMFTCERRCFSRPCYRNNSHIIKSKNLICKRCKGKLMYIPYEKPPSEVMVVKEVIVID